HIPLFECGKCKHQTSPLVGTIFEGTHLPLPDAAGCACPERKKRCGRSCCRCVWRFRRSLTAG
ncbi:hypothetical protein BK140_30810, partial [Paenibacillus macerans]